MEIVWDRIGREEWAGATAGLDLPMQQHWTYAAVLAALGRQVRRAEIVAGGGRIWLAQVVSRRCGPFRLTLLSRGPVWLRPVAPDVAARVLRLLARGNGLTLATPEMGSGGRGLIPLVTPRHQAVIDLRPALPVIRAGFDGKWRNRLVRAEGQGLEVRRSVPDAAALARLLAREADQQRRCGYRALPPGFTLGWAAADPGGLRLYEARQGIDAVAAMLMLLHPPSASYHLGWSGAAGRRANAHQLLLWQAIRDLEAEGIRALDLGGVNTEEAPGLARFKIGSGACVAPLGATVLVLPASIPRRP